MAGGWIRAGRPAASTLAELRRLAEAGALSYRHVGSTLDPAAWPDRKMYEETVLLGAGDAVFAAAGDALRSWVCHRGIGARVFPADAALVEGTTLLVALPIGPASVVVPNRVVWTVDEADRYGFGYGTIHGHQETGEEAFLAHRSEDGTVRATIRVDARTVTVAANALRPAVRAFQKAALRRYLRAWQADVASRVR